MSLFGFSQEHVDREVRKAKDEVRRETEESRKTERLEHELEKKELNKDHELELKGKEFQLTHLADERVKKAEDEKTRIKEELAVAKKENEMLGKITDLNADVIDVKKLVADLINKLPTVNITAGLSTGGGQKGGGGGKEKDGQ